MRNILFGILLCTTAFVVLSGTVKDVHTDLTSDFIFGNPEISAIHQMSFGPEGILFLGDSKNATVYALDTKDITANQEASDIDVGEFDQKIAASLGTQTDNIKINDMAVNPVSKSVYFAVQTGDGTPVLLKWSDNRLEPVSLEQVSYSKMALEDPIAADAQDRRNRSLRTWAISDIKYHDGQVLLTGLSNKEFGSTFRSIPFPFKGAQDYASLEIYHAAHGKYETHSPIKTFDILTMEGTDYVMASYTCTPLVLFPLNELKSKTHAKGRTVAELGSGNSPLDMVSIEKDGKPYFVMSNTNRPIMRLDYEDIANFKDSLKEPVTEYAVATGVEYVSLPLVNVLQLDNLDGDKVVYLQRTAEGDMVFRSRPTRRM